MTHTSTIATPTSTASSVQQALELAQPLNSYNLELHDKRPEFEKKIRDTEAQVEKGKLALAQRKEQALVVARQIEAMEAKIKTLLPIEEDLREALKAECRKLRPFLSSASAEKYLEQLARDVQDLKGRIEDFSKKFEWLKEVSSKYPRLSLEPLTWRDSKKLPRLVIFSLECAEFYFASGWGTEVYKKHHEHPSRASKAWYWLGKYYDDVEDLLQKRRSKTSKNWELSCRFTGEIPPQVKEKIVEARQWFSGETGTCLCIIAEPSDWTLQEFKSSSPFRIRDGDPLVVGYNYYADKDSLWLIADFDTTPIEEAMICNFESN